ncbi:ABC transporter ATP-binding protein [Acidovorax sp. CCYZU-2555]|uniref:ABC transporter ATP-binding protein n=1 Tax=Acidovorax sp. CCYZU-2555 TaxID=2835042 RepID=UPI001BCC4CD1|nr:ABC transporter ATP-binding protein [Acidovorax sp. CCYZU-2555]MBS7777099.1 ABC transporter ATP-binding protein [Acidovorax sp. CCYZU-2555]
MSSDFAIDASGLSKRYPLYNNPSDRLMSLLWGRKQTQDQSFWALQDVNLQVARGEVVGLVGRNGAGKSTLLQLLCGTIPSSSGQLRVQGRVAALLELGAGFNPDFTGIENIFMNGAILGMKRHEIEQRLDEIVEFADIGDFIHKPVKTYSSGMYVRLAFAVATSTDPDILIIDEALSVGDGAFARKSFDRIMRLKEAGKTIFFCSHSMYQVEALCARAIWMEKGRVKMDGNAADVTSAYAASLNAPTTPTPEQEAAAAPAPSGTGRIIKAVARTRTEQGSEVKVLSGKSDLTIDISFEIDPHLPAPGVAIGISDANGTTVTSAISVNDGVVVPVDAQGRGQASILFKKFSLLKGSYWVTCFLTSEDGLHPYDQVLHCLRLNVTQEGTEQGFVSLPRDWITAAAPADR